MPQRWICWPQCPTHLVSRCWPHCCTLFLAANCNSESGSRLLVAMPYLVHRSWPHYTTSGSPLLAACQIWNWRARATFRSPPLLARVRPSSPLLTVVPHLVPSYLPQCCIRFLPLAAVPYMIARCWPQSWIWFPGVGRSAAPVSMTGCWWNKTMLTQSMHSRSVLPSKGHFHLTNTVYFINHINPTLLKAKKCFTYIQFKNNQYERLLIHVFLQKFLYILNKNLNCPNFETRVPSGAVHKKLNPKNLALLSL